MLDQRDLEILGPRQHLGQVKVIPGPKASQHLSGLNVGVDHYM